MARGLHSWSPCARVSSRPALAAAEPTVDLSAYRADSGIAVRHTASQLRSRGRSRDGTGQLDLDLRPGQPLIRAMGISRRSRRAPAALLENADPVTFLLVGSPSGPGGPPPGHERLQRLLRLAGHAAVPVYRVQLELKRVRVASQGHRATISIGDVTIGPFTGELRLTLYRGASLVHVETVVHTQEDRRAILYDTGLALPPPSKTRFAWVDTEGKLLREEASPDAIGSPPGGPASRADRGNRLGLGGVFSAPSPVFLSARPDRQPADGLVRPRSPRAGRAVRLRHPPVRARRRLVRPLVQRPARHRPAAGRLLSPFDRRRRAMP